MRLSSDYTGKLPQISFESLLYWEEVEIVAPLEKPIPGGLFYWHVAHDRLANRGDILTEELTSYPTARTISAHHDTSVIRFFLSDNPDSAALSYQLQHFFPFTDLCPTSTGRLN